MVFSSLTFLFFFITITAVLYFIAPGLKLKNVVLLLASILFYSWGEPVYVLLMLVTVLVAYIGGLIIDKAKGGFKKFIYVLSCIIILSSLFVFKYLDFALVTLGKDAVGLSLPIGISFYTFQVLSYVIDLYRGEVGLQKNYFRLLLYVAFFPQLIAGPIVRYSTVEEEIGLRHSSVDDIAAGLRRFILGLSKKCIIANGVAEIAELIYAAEDETAAVYGTAVYWLAAVCYALQIYYDFSGYSDMAIGLGRIFGFHFLENFDHPYLAKSITDFWRRWHISLSSWFRDYVYIPLGGNRKGLARQLINILIVWSLTGLWHGASWNFVLWGLYYAFFLMLEKLFLGKLLDKCPGIIKHIYTLLIVIVGWVLFNITDFAKLWFVLTKMFTYSGSVLFDVVAADSAILRALVFVPLAIISLFAQPVVDAIKKHELLANIICLVLFALCVVFVLSTSYNPFIYFRF